MTPDRFHRLAAQELRAAHQLYLARNPAVAQRFLDAVDDAVHRLARDPLSHPTDIRHSRWVKVRRFPFRLIFEQLGSNPILILAVAHHRRRPGYWRKRHE